MPAHAVARRPALPALLLTVAAAALGGLALLPGQAAPAPAVLASSVTPAVAALNERAAVLGRPPLRRSVAARAVAAPRPKAAPVRPALPRATRSRTDVPPVPLVGYVCPVRGRVSFSNDWGAPRSGGRGHRGTDMMAAYGTPVVAVISGVVQTDYSASGGISLYLRGTDGDTYFYAHNSRNVAVSGQRVVTGEVIAYVGASGNAPKNAPHVHFERHPGGGAAVNPYPFVSRVC